MSIALDYTARIAPSALKANDVSLVFRYIAPQKWKVISPAEYQELKANGIQVILNWESAADDWKGGFTSGRSHGQSASAMADQLGYPKGSVIVGSCDFDVTSWASISGYALGFAGAIMAAGFVPGVYGPWNALEWVDEAGFGYGFFWQAGMSTSWSGGKNKNLHPKANVRQRGHKTVGGQDTDWNEIISLPSSEPKKDPIVVRNGVVAMNKNQANLLDAVFNLSDTVVQYGVLQVKAGWNIDQWVKDLQAQGHGTIWAQIVAFNPGILDNVDFASNTFKSDYEYIDPSKSEEIPNPLAQAVKAQGTVTGSPEVDLDALTDKIVAKLSTIEFKAV
jgi:hypothetical protein